MPLYVSAILSSCAQSMCVAVCCKRRSSRLLKLSFSLFAITILLISYSRGFCATTLFSDDFNRADSDTVGNGWTVEEGGGDVDIVNGHLYFGDTNDESNRPLVSHSFATVTSGFMSWSFTFDWMRTGGEQTYRLFMQLGDSDLMTTPGSGEEPNAGVAANLVWTDIGGNHESLGYAVSGAYTSIAQVSGSLTVEIVADLDTQTYAVFLDGTGVLCGVPFDNAVDIDTIRIISDQINDNNFSGRRFDDVVVSEIDTAPGDGWPPVAQDQSVTTDEDTSVDITLTAVDCDDNILDYNVVALPDHGQLTGSPPNVTYLPYPGYTGTDSFTFTADDGYSESNLAVVTILVSGDAGALNDIDDFIDSADGVSIYWQKARYEDLNISGTETMDIPFGIAYPSGYNLVETTEYPLVLYLHGASARGDNNNALKRATSRFFAKSARTDPDKWNAFVLTPQCATNYRWVESNWGAGPYNQTDTPGNTYGEYMHLAEGLLHYLIDSDHNGALIGVLGMKADDIDTRRIYVVGDSMGAYGTWDIVARLPGFFAGAISSGGSGPKNKLDELRLTPFWAIHGEGDGTVPNYLPDSGDPDGAGSLGMLGLLDPSFDGVHSTDIIYVDDPESPHDDPPGTWPYFIYSEFPNAGHAPAADWTTRPTYGVREWLFARMKNPVTCAYDDDGDIDVDGSDLAGLAPNLESSKLPAFAEEFGGLCP